MTKEQLKEIIELYKNTESAVIELDDKYGICVWNSDKPNFYNNYNLIIHKFWVILFGQENTDILEEYIFEQNSLTFDELCNILEIKDETDKK